MKQKLTGLSRRYAWALKKYLRQGARGTVHPARGLGIEAVKLGLETLDVAKIHEATLATLEASSSRDGIIKRAEIFFTEAVSPIEKTHHAAVKASAHLSQVNRALDRRMVDLAASNRSLKQSIVRRKTAEEALRKRGGALKSYWRSHAASRNICSIWRIRYWRRRRTNDGRSATSCRMKSPRHC